jgi:integrase
MGLRRMDSISLRTQFDAHDAFYVLMPPQPDKDMQHRIKRYLLWLKETRRSWLEADLAAYRDYLLNDGELAASSVSAHLATVRSRYRAVLRSAQVRNRLYALTPPDAPLADRKAVVDEILQRMRDWLDPEAAPVSTFTNQDQPDSQRLRLTAGQARQLMQAPGISTLRGMRDTALLSLVLCTGLREAELCGLDVSDLRQRFEGELALYVRAGKGRKRRLIPYGELDWVLALVDLWLNHAGIEAGAVLRGFYKGSKTVRKTRLTERAVHYIVQEYPITIDGEPRVVQPHDLRRTYARRLYEAGLDINRIRQNLGHTDLQTTLAYIGDLDAPQRRPPAIYQPPHRLR